MIGFIAVAIRYLRLTGRNGSRERAGPAFIAADTDHVRMAHERIIARSLDGGESRGAELRERGAHAEQACQATKMAT